MGLKERLVEEMDRAMIFIGFLCLIIGVISWFDNHVIVKTETIKKVTTYYMSEAGKVIKFESSPEKLKPNYKLIQVHYLEPGVHEDWYNQFNDAAIEFDFRAMRRKAGN